MLRLPWFALVFPLVLLLAAGGCGSSPGNFALSATPSSVAVTAGATAQISITATAVSGFGQPVTVTVSGLAAGVTASPATLTLTPGTAGTVTLSAAGSAPAGTGTASLLAVSGSLSHELVIPVAVAVAPPPPPPLAPDFSLSVSPATETITAGGSGSSIAVLATPANGFAGTVAVAITGLPSGVTAAPASLSLAAGVAQTLTLTAGSSAVAGTASVTLTASSGSLSHTATLGLTVSPAPTAAPTPSAGPDVLTYHYDNFRDGLNSHETVLSPFTVNSTSFGLLGIYPVDGKVDAQPLYVGGLNLPSGTANVLYVATENDSVYALDARTGRQYWKTSVLGAGETPSDARGCNQIVPEIGITATPVIDRAQGAHSAIFLVGMTEDASGGYHQRLHALDLTTGAELAGSPAEIQASFPGNGENSTAGRVIFDPAQYVARAGLLLLNSKIYMGFSSHCDIAPYTGWMMGYSEAALTQASVLDLTPNGSDGSIWMAGYGIAADAGGNIYVLDANGTLDSTFNGAGFPNGMDFGNAMLKISTGGGGLAVSDFFEPYNTVQESLGDQDLGAGGAMLLPDLPDNAGAVHQLMIGAGKDGNIYVGDRNNLGKFNGSAPSNGNVYQELVNALPNGAWSGPAYFNSTVYYAGVNDVLKAYTITNAKLSLLPTSQSATRFPYPGSTPSVSSDGNAGGIVWALESGTSAPAVLHAFDATDLSNELYNSNQAPNGRDAFGPGNKFLTPAVSNGMVFVGTPSGVAVFGLLSR